MSIGLAAGVKHVATLKLGPESWCASDLECSRLKTTTAPALVESHDAARDKAEQELAGAVDVLTASEHCSPGANAGNPTRSHTLVSSVFEAGGGEFRRLLLIVSKANEESAAGLVRFPRNQLKSDGRCCSTIESRGECFQSPNMRVVGAQVCDWWLWVALRSHTVACVRVASNARQGGVVLVPSE